MKSKVDAYITQKNLPVVKPIFLYEIQYDKATNSWLKYANWNEDVVFDGETYTKYPIEHDGVSENLDGKSTKVNLTIANADRNIQYYLENYNGLRDAQVNILQVFKDELSNPQVVDTMTFFVVDVGVNVGEARLVLALRYDAFAISLPRRLFYRGYCSHKFKGVACGYSGGETVCDKSLQRCVELGNVQRYGGFPAIPQRNVYKLNVSKS